MVVRKKQKKNQKAAKLPIIIVRSSEINFYTLTSKPINRRFNSDTHLLGHSGYSVTNFSLIRRWQLIGRWLNICSWNKLSQQISKNKTFQTEALANIIHQKELKKAEAVEECRRRRLYPY